MAHQREAPPSLSPKQRQAIALWMARVIRRHLLPGKEDHERSRQGAR
jgi:hypothetical protein